MSFCTECGYALPENAKFCPNCGKALVAVSAAAAPEVVPEPVVAEEPVPVAEEPAPAEELSPVVAEEPAPAPEPAEEPEPEPEPESEPEPVPEPTPEPEPVPETIEPEVIAPAAEPASCGLHPVGIAAIVMTALTASFLGFSLIALYLHLHPVFAILFTIVALVCSVVAFGVGVASFIVGLVKKKNPTWIAGLAAALFAFVNFVLSIIYLIGTIIAAVA